MIEIQISTQSLTKTIVTFHANTVEFFYATAKQGGQSFHVGHIKSFEVIERRGKQYLELKTDFTNIAEEISPSALSKARDMVTEVQKAMQAFSA